MFLKILFCCIKFNFRCLKLYKPSWWFDSVCTYCTWDCTLTVHHATHNKEDCGVRRDSHSLHSPLFLLHLCCAFPIWCPFCSPLLWASGVDGGKSSQGQLNKTSQRAPVPPASLETKLDGVFMVIRVEWEWLLSRHPLTFLCHSYQHSHIFHTEAISTASTTALLATTNCWPLRKRRSL